MSETSKAHERRVRENWYNYIQSPGIDIGCQHDPINEDFRKWDVIFGDGDATFMEGVEDESYMTVYASHVLEHIDNPELAIQNWFRVLKPGGHLIICVPHRDLYEKKTELPSNWNHEHKWFWLQSEDQIPCTKGLKSTIERAIPGVNIVAIRTLADNFISNGPVNHSSGEYSIEAIVRK